MNSIKFIYNDNIIEVYSITIKTQNNNQELCIREFNYNHAYTIGYGQLVKIKPVNNDNQYKKVKWGMMGLFKIKDNKMTWLNCD